MALKNSDLSYACEKFYFWTILPDFYSATCGNSVSNLVFRTKADNQEINEMDNIFLQCCYPKNLTLRISKRPRWNKSYLICLNRRIIYKKNYRDTGILGYIVYWRELLTYPSISHLNLRTGAFFPNALVFSFYS